MRITHHAPHHGLSSINFSSYYYGFLNTKSYPVHNVAAVLFLQLSSYQYLITMLEEPFPHIQFILPI
jgi:hypothetical protein